MGESFSSSTACTGVWMAREFLGACAWQWIPQKFLNLAKPSTAKTSLMKKLFSGSDPEPAPLGKMKMPIQW